jgi:hypothetical protein
LNVKIDGRYSYFEWINAARYDCGNERGTMALVAQGILKQVWFGFSAEKLLIRVDTEGPARESLESAEILRVAFLDPADWEINVPNPSVSRPLATIYHAGAPSSNGTTVDAATDKILELAVPFGRMGLKATDPVRFYIELVRGQTSLDRAPREGIFELTVPTPDFERIMWQV